MGNSFAGSSPAEELGEGGSGETVRRDRGEEDEHRQALTEVDVRDLLREAEMPASRVAADHYVYALTDYREAQYGALK